jgi:hypothetical protein
MARSKKGDVMRGNPLHYMLGTMALIGATSTAAQCPAGYVVTSHNVQKQGEEEFDVWTCRWGGGQAARTALEQLQRMGQGKVDTGTGFDGGLGPTSAVAKAPPTASFPNLKAVTEADLQKFGSDPKYAAASQELHYATTARKEAEAQTAELRQRQARLTDSLARQQLQIEIARAEQALTAARGAERIAENQVVKEIVRLKPQVLEAPPPPEVGKPKAKGKAK